MVKRASTKCNHCTGCHKAKRIVYTSIVGTRWCDDCYQAGMQRMGERRQMRADEKQP